MLLFRSKIFVVRQFFGTEVKNRGPELPTLSLFLVCGEGKFRIFEMELSEPLRGSDLHPLMIASHLRVVVSMSRIF